MSNIFMELIETYYIFPQFPTIKWVRYVDDVFALIPRNINTDSVLNFINEIHNDIKFTIEKSENNKINFLDVLTTWNNEEPPSFSIYRKPTANTSFIHWFSCHDVSTKTAVLSNLFLRAFRSVSYTHLRAHETP